MQRGILRQFPKNKGQYHDTKSNRYRTHFWAGWGGSYTARAASPDPINPGPLARSRPSAHALSFIGSSGDDEIPFFRHLFVVDINVSSRMASFLNGIPVNTINTI